MDLINVSNHAQYELAMRYRTQWYNERTPANTFVTPMHNSLVWISGELMSNDHLIKSEGLLNPQIALDMTFARVKGANG